MDYNGLMIFIVYEFVSGSAFINYLYASLINVGNLDKIV